MTGRSDEAADRNRFGTFGGVFTPTILTIFGVIMFMRAGYVTGEAGVLAAIAILALSKLITLCTGLSIAAISTNAEVKGGGAYFLISRTLGPEFGGAIGLALFLAQALSVPFYILGFAESLVVTFPALESAFGWITIGTAALLFVVTYVGAGWAIRFQYVVLAVLAIAIVTFMVGAALRFDGATLQANWEPRWTEGNDFWVIFAIYFPAVTGIMAGVNMSGDLAEPARAIPRGTLAAIGVGFVVYLLEVVLLGAAAPRAELVARPYETLLDIALFGAGFLVAAGVFAATVSSALGSLLGAPRILQALARDDIFRPLKPFAVGTAQGDEPRRSLWVTFAITLVVLWAAGDDPKSGAFNAVAALLTMFFLYTYGMTNLAAFVESITHNPSFRPRFRFFHWSAALVGALGCVGAAVLIDPVAALVAVGLIAAVFLYVRSRVLQAAFGDARRGFYFSRVKSNLARLAASPPHPKNWRPNTLVLSGNPHTRRTLTAYAGWLASQRGLVTLAEVLVGRFEQRIGERRAAIERLQRFIREENLPAYPEVLVTDEFDHGLADLLQAHSIGPLKPNLIVLGWPTDPERVRPFARALRIAEELSMSMVVTRDAGLPPEAPAPRRIDIWWRGLENGELMALLAYLLTHNLAWSNARIRILRATRDAARVDADRAELLRLVEAARIDAELRVFVSDEPFATTLHRHSSDASVVLLGFQPPSDDEAPRFHAQYTRLLDGLPTTLMVYSSGEAELMA